MRCLLSILVGGILQVYAVQAQLIISEYQTANATTVLWEGESDDWIELYNTTGNELALDGWSVSDDRSEPNRFPLPNTSLAPNTFLLIRANGMFARLARPYQAPFRLSDGSDTVFHFYDSVLVQQLTTPCIPEDKSFGVLPGDTVYSLLRTPTPGFSNATDSFAIQLYSDSLTVSVGAGFYIEQQEVTLTSSATTTEIWYSLNSDEPEPDELFYASPIAIEDRSQWPDKLADEPTSPDWIEPDGPTYKGTVLRARGFFKGCPVTPEVVETYYYAANEGARFAVPVVNVVSNRDHFFDFEEGIYVPGVNLNPNDAGYSGNYFETGRDWERPAFVNLMIDNQVVWKQQLGIRTHGNTSRSYPQKSLRLYARKSYGGDTLMRYPFFDDRSYDTFNRLVIRTAQADISGTFFKDPLCHAIAAQMHVDYMSSSTSVVFINGEYWGIHNLRERQDEGYLISQYGADLEGYDLISVNNFSKDPLEIDEGSMDAYNQLMNDLYTLDPNSTQFFEYLNTHIDLENFIDYHILQLFVANEDWLNANTKFWKSHEAGSKWRWLFFDCDRCFNLSQSNRLNGLMETVVDDGWPEWATNLQRRVFKSETFQKSFSARYYELLNTTFSTGNLLGLIEGFERTYAPLVPEHIKRWQAPATVYAWQDNVEHLKRFAIERPVHAAKLLERHFEQPFYVYPNPANQSFQIGSSAGDFGTQHVRVFGRDGREVLSFKGVSSTTVLDCSGLESGYYVVRIEGNELFFTTSLIVLG